MVFDQSATTNLTEIISAGVDCYLLKKELTPLLLVKAVELVLLGSVILSNHLARDAGSALGNIARPSGRKNSVIPEPSIMHLSNKERGILLSLIDGCSNKQIAREHGITEATVKVHVKNLFVKIGVRNRTQAAIWGIGYLNKTDTCANSSVYLDLVQNPNFLSK